MYPTFAHVFPLEVISYTSQNPFFCQPSENMPELVALQVERALMTVTARDRVVAGGKKREQPVFAAVWSVETIECVSAAYVMNLFLFV